jgi:exoribonuclease R
MARAEERGNRVENAVNNLAESVLLDGREGELFDGVIVDEDRNGPLMQIAEPAILARVHAARVTPGDEVRVRLVEADPVARRVGFERVG